MIVSFLLSVLSLSSVLCQCPEDLADLPTAAFSPSAGCLWADNDEDHRFDNFEAATQRCRDVFGPEGRLVEILSAEDQQLAVEVMAAAESTFILNPPELSYWWSGLRDDDDDGVWVWTTSNTPLNYSDWHPAAVPNVKDFNCMQLLSGTVYQGQWMTYTCGDNTVNTHALCQLKLSSGTTTTKPTDPATTPEPDTTVTDATTTTINTTTTTTTTTTEPQTTVPEAGEILAITFITGSCVGCPQEDLEGGLVVSLVTTSEETCQTEGLDHPDRRDYQQGQQARFATSEEGMAGCETFPGGPPTGGSVTWTGTGVFAARNREICAELSGEGGSVETWCCTMAKASSSQNIAVSLNKCQLSYLV